MRYLLVIALLAAVAVTLVKLRRAEITARHETLRLQRAEVRLRRRLWDQQIRLGYLTTPQAVRQRADEMSLGLTDRAPDGLASVHRVGGR